MYATLATFKPGSPDPAAAIEYVLEHAEDAPHREPAPGEPPLPEDPPVPGDPPDSPPSPKGLDAWE
jgi:hypothetical protein